MTEEQLLAGNAIREKLVKLKKELDFIRTAREFEITGRKYQWLGFIERSVAFGKDNEPDIVDVLRETIAYQLAAKINYFEKQLKGL